MKVHWWGLAGNLLVLLAVVENISFSLVSSENKVLSKAKRKEIKETPSQILLRALVYGCHNLKSTNHTKEVNQS